MDELENKNETPVAEPKKDAPDKKAQKAQEKAEKSKHYISAKESRNIAKENRRTVKALQKKRAGYKREDYVTEMRDPANIVEFDNLHTYFYTDNGVVKAVNGVSFDIPQGSTVGVVGESGCGKSVTSLSLMQLVQGPAGQIVDGSIRFRSTVRTQKEGPVLDENGNPKLGKDGKPVMQKLTEPVMREKKDEEGKPVLDEEGKPVLEPVLGKNGKPLMRKVYEEHEEVYDVAKMPISEMTSIRGREIAMIFQEPMTSLNPVFTIGYQLDEVSLLHINGADKAMAKARSLEMLELVGIAMPEHVYKSYPHQLSGGMRQRVMIAMALCCNPKLIIADEPTTALDVTIQAQILDLLRDVKQKISGSIMLITHDLGVIAEMVDYVVVMYAGRIVEKGTVQEIFKNPMHPYTVGLQKSKPVVRRQVDRLYSIPGNVPNPINMPSYCYFRGRCGSRCAKCAGEYPPLVQVSPTHFVACWLADPNKAWNGEEAPKAPVAETPVAPVAEPVAPVETPAPEAVKEPETPVEKPAEPAQKAPAPAPKAAEKPAEPVKETPAPEAVEELAAAAVAPAPKAKPEAVVDGEKYKGFIIKPVKGKKPAGKSTRGKKPAPKGTEDKK